MTHEEHLKYLEEKEVIESKRERHLKYDSLCNSLKKLEKMKVNIEKYGVQSLEAHNVVYNHIYVVDEEFAKEKVLEIYNREIEVLKKKIDEL